MSKRGNRDLKRTYFQIAATLVWLYPHQTPYRELFEEQVAAGRLWYRAMPYVWATLARHIYQCLTYAGLACRLERRHVCGGVG